MNTEEIDYWLRLFSNNNQSFMSKDGKKITLFKVFQELKELHYLLKIKNDYINELETYKYNLDRDYLRLAKENKQLKDNWNKIEQIIENERMSHWTPSPLFLTELLSKMQELEKILKEVE